MSSRIDDRWLWLGFGVFLFASAWRIRHAIQDLVALTYLSPVYSASEHPDTRREREKEELGDPEDSISVETLRTLASSPNPNIANAATSLIVSQFLRLPDASRLVSQDLLSGDATTRRKAETAVHFLQEWGSDLLDSPFSPHRDASLAGELLGRVTSAELVERLGGGGELAGEEGYVSRFGEDGLVPSVRDPVAGWTNVPRARPTSRVGVGGDAAEAERRRRRREAMVLHEGEGGIGEEDIFRPAG